MKCAGSRFLVMGALALLLAGRPAMALDAATAQLPPQELVKTVSSEVLDDIKADPALHAGDINKLQKLIDEKVAPYVDFERMTRLAVGRGWRTATPEQRDRLMQEFRTLLVRTYSGAFTRVTDHKIVMKPFRGQPSDTDAVVRSEVAPSSGEPVQLDYRMEKTDKGWKIYDVNILGVSLVENFRNSFASQINQGGVDGLIKALADRNRELAAGQKS